MELAYLKAVVETRVIRKRGWPFTEIPGGHGAYPHWEQNQSQRHLNHQGAERFSVLGYHLRHPIHVLLPCKGDDP